MKPGISDLSVNPTQVEAYMNPLLGSTKLTILEDKHVSTPIFLLATAGMRRLPEDQANVILGEVRKLLTTKRNVHFCFRTMIMARITAGQVEGIYGWVTVTFILGVFALKDSASYVS